MSNHFIVDLHTHPYESKEIGTGFEYLNFIDEKITQVKVGYGVNTSIAVRKASRHPT
jgi:hypothetical protein